MKNEHRRMDIRKWIEYCCIYDVPSVAGSAHQAEETSRAGKFNFIVDYKMS